MIDWERVEGLRSEVGPEDFRDVVELFLEEVQEIVSRLSTHPDPARYEQDLHFLKGSALNLGFRQVAILCQAGENDAAAGRAESVEIGNIVSCYGQSRRAFMARARQYGITPPPDDDSKDAIS